MTLVFGDPPKSRGGRGPTNWVEVTDILRANPNEWCHVGRFSSSVARQIRQGLYSAFLGEGVERGSTEARAYMAAHWEVTSRTSDEKGRLDVWIRWLG
jgi:hypothetical protein